ncbi:MCE family protein [Aldersonia kunmingensis]|uniref:MCE family protein n=1 Tax=Aldersonia kunmingensis TaxID=408066 RepID=UPI000A03AD05|nr:MCE family protein [Aldersonia kunmingensis]
MLKKDRTGPTLAGIHERLDALPRPDFETHRHFWLGIAVSLSVIVLLVGASALSYIRVGDKSVEVEFAQGAGMRPGDTVDVGGVEVGRVQSARIDGDHVVATLRIRDDIRLGPDARAAIEMSTILGRIHIDLAPGDGKGLPGNRIPLGNTDVPYNLAKVVNDPSYKTQFEHLERIDPQKLRAALDVLNEQMGGSAALTIDAVNSIGSLAGVITQRTQQVDGLLKNLDTVSELVSDNRNSVLVLLSRGEAVGKAVQLRQDLVRQLLDNVAALSKMLQDLGAENNNQLGSLIDNLDVMSQGLEKNRENLDRLYQMMPVTMRQFNNVLGNGPYGEVYAPWLFPDNWLCFAQVVQGCK